MGDKKKADHSSMFGDRVGNPVECFEISTGDKVKARRVLAKEKSEFIIPDHYDAKGQPVGHGGSISVVCGDLLIEREDGTVFGVKAADFQSRFGPIVKVDI